jgi:hypothetical protein
MKFKVGDVLVDNRGNVYEVTFVRRDRNYPYITKRIVGEWISNVWSFGANGEFCGTGNPGSVLDVTLAVDYIVNKMWEEYNNG